MALGMAIGLLALALLAASLDGLRRARVRRTQERPAGRPIALVAADVRRLGLRYRTLPPYASFVKVEAIRSGYDRALAEYADSLGLAHLIHVLAPGPDLDAERTRVGRLLEPYLEQPPHAA